MMSSPLDVKAASFKASFVVWLLLVFLLFFFAAIRLEM